jgi:hypothetical protein
MKPATNPTGLRVQAVLGPSFTLLEFETSTRTAADAAAAIGCTVGQIAKSLVFRKLTSDQPVLIVASGPNRVNEAKVAQVVGEAIGRAEPALPSGASDVCWVTSSHPFHIALHLNRATGASESALTCIPTEPLPAPNIPSLRR